MYLFPGDVLSQYKSGRPCSRKKKTIGGIQLSEKVVQLGWDEIWIGEKSDVWMTYVPCQPNSMIIAELYNYRVIFALVPGRLLFLNVTITMTHTKYLKIGWTDI